MLRTSPALWFLCETPCRWYWRLKLALEVRGEALPKGALLIAAKHASSFDILLIGHITKVRDGRIPFFQMGSFEGYRFLGPVAPLLQKLGGFPVMRPKDVRRIAEKTGRREEALQRMRTVNDAAEATRAQVLLKGGVLVVYPEGTRDGSALRPFKSTLEVESALRVHALGTPVHVQPVSIAYAPARWFRRRVLVEFGPAFVLADGMDAAGVLERVHSDIASRWVNEEGMSAGGKPRAEREVNT